MKASTLFLLLCLFAVSTAGWAQEEDDYYEGEDAYYDESYDEYADDYSDEAEDLSEDIMRKSEFAIPSSPAFSLLGVTPEMVTRPGSVQDFKVDWRLKNYNIAPDLALEAQPLWALYFDRKGIDAYRKASPFLKTLSTFSTSFGTAKMDGLNHFTYAFKISLFRENDPLSDPLLLKEMSQELAQLEEPIKQDIARLRAELDSAVTREDRLILREEMFNSREELKAIRRAQKIKLIETQQDYMNENWNSAGVDLAFGKVSTFNNALDTLNISNAGWGFWINGAIGAGRNGLLTGIFKVKKIGENQDLLLGASYRFGGYRFSFFTELVYESLENLRFNDFSEDEIFAGKYAEDLGVGWYQFAEALESVSQLTLTYGGDFRLANGINLNFSLRTKLDQTLKFKKLLPVANVTCLMR